MTDEHPNIMTKVLIVDDMQTTRDALTRLVCGLDGTGAPGVLTGMPFAEEVDFLEAVSSAQSEAWQGCVVLVNLHLRLFQQSRRGDCHGLRLLDELVLALGEQCPPVLLYTLLDKGQVWRLVKQEYRSLATPWLHAPRRLGEAGANFASLVWPLLKPKSPTGEELSDRVLSARQVWTVEALGRLARSTAEDYLEHDNRYIRHLFVKDRAIRRPAVRILLGADGIVSRGNELAACLMKLAQDEGCLAQVAERLTSERRRKLVSLARAGGRLLPVASVATDLKLLWIDDRCCDSGWKESLEACFGGSVTAVPDIPQAPQIVNFDAVLLDYELGKDKTSADWLRRVRAENPEVPILLFTTSDRADIALWCLQHGANDYFVKEPYDPLGRGSRTHFGRLAALLAALSADNVSQSRGLWRRNQPVRKLVADVWRGKAAEITAIDTNLQGLHDHGTLRWHLGQVCRMLLSSLDDFYVSRGVTAGGTDLLHSVALARLSYHATACMEILAVKRLKEECPAYCRQHIDNFFNGAYGWRKMWLALHHKEYADTLTADAERLGKWDAFEKLSHWRAYLPTGSAPSPDLATEFLEEVVLPRLSTSDTAAATVSSRILEPMEAPPSPSPEPPVGSHGEIQALGAKELCDGFCEIVGLAHNADQVWDYIRGASGSRPQVPQVLEPRLKALQVQQKWLLVDDEPDSPFVRVLRLILRHLASRVELCAVGPKDTNSAPTCENLEPWDLVLLDLDFGPDLTPPERDQAGFDWLWQLRAENRCWGVPVCVLTAHVDSLNLREALRGGALGYVPKRVSGRSPRESVEYILAQFDRVSAFLPVVRELRCLESRLHSMSPAPRVTNAQVQESLGQHLGMSHLPQNDRMVDAWKAVKSALLASWCYIYLNATRTQRTDLWLEQLFCASAPDSVFLQDAVVAMGCAIEPLALASRVVYESGAESAGGVLADNAALPAQDCRRMPKVDEMRSLWRLRNDCEHGTPSPLLQECIQLLSKALDFVHKYPEWFERTTGGGGGSP